MDDRVNDGQRAPVGPERLTRMVLWQRIRDSSDDAEQVLDLLAQYENMLRRDLAHELLDESDQFVPGGFVDGVRHAATRMLDPSFATGDADR